jgi:shikimate kinase
MGSGKTTIGRQLSERLYKSFVDLDTKIESDYLMTISEIFAQQGEDAFRKIEHETLIKVCDTDNQVISVGGGAPCFHNNIDLMNQNGTTVYLKLSAEALANRLIGLPKQARESRPLIANKTKEELFDFITFALQKREQFYCRSKIIVINESMDTSKSLERIITALKYS